MRKGSFRPLRSFTVSIERSIFLSVRFLTFGVATPFGLEETAQKLFFDSLYQHSAGIFRSAFQLWLGSIESVEGETLNIRQPLDAAFARFRNELAQEDQFTLLAIQEHGSLTRDELSEVLREKPDNAGSRMDRLFALGLIENDPDHPGYRVSPEAQRFVNDLLRRTNFT